MSKRAIDIAILPPESIVGLAIEYNKKILPHDDRIILEKGVVRPHITLAMAGIYEDNMRYLQNTLRSISANYNPFTIEIDGFNGKWLTIQNTDVLQNLHEDIMDGIKEITDQTIDESMVGDPPNPDADYPAKEFSANFVGVFREQKAYENFNPHITCGADGDGGEALVREFEATNLSVCQLGGYCTCRDVLWETQLNN